MAVEHLTKENDDGTTFGQSASEKISVYNVTPIVQPSGASQGAVAAQTQVALTDNGGGTADGTVASQAEPVILTDSTGLSATHDDTLAASAAPVTLTDSTGDSGTHDDTLADGLTATAPAAITNYAAVVNMTNPVTKTEGETFSAAMAVLEDEVTALRATVAACVTDLAVQNQNDSDVAQKVIQLVTLVGVLAQNDSDLAQKVIELVTLSATAQDNLKEVTTRLAEVKADVANVKTLQDAERTALVNFGIIKGAA